MGVIALLEPLLRRANRHPELRVAFHPSRWDMVSITLEALGPEWDIRLHVSANVSPYAIYLMGAGAAPISRAQVSTPGSAAPAPPAGLNAHSSRRKPNPQPEVDPTERRSK